MRGYTIQLINREPLCVNKFCNPYKKTYQTLNGVLKDEHIRHLSTIGKQLLKDVLVQHRVAYNINAWVQMIVVYTAD